MVRSSCFVLWQSGSQPWRCSDKKKTFVWLSIDSKFDRCELFITPKQQKEFPMSLTFPVQQAFNLQSAQFACSTSTCQHHRLAWKTSEVCENQRQFSPLLAILRSPAGGKNARWPSWTLLLGCGRTKVLSVLSGLQHLVTGWEQTCSLSNQPVLFSCKQLRT